MTGTARYRGMKPRDDCLAYPGPGPARITGAVIPRGTASPMTAIPESIRNTITLRLVQDTDGGAFGYVTGVLRGGERISLCACASAAQPFAAFNIADGTVIRSPCRRVVALTHSGRCALGGQPGLRMAALTPAAPTRPSARGQTGASVALEQIRYKAGR
jgi:hypothetical protein